MTKKTMLRWGVALAVMTAPALLSPGFAQGNGNGNGGKKGAEAQGGKGQQRNESQGKPQGGPKGNSDRGGGQAMKPQKQFEMPRGNGPSNDNRNGNASIGPDRKFRAIVEDNRNGWKRAAKRDYRPNPVIHRNDRDVLRLGFGNRYDYYDGCPPGLAKKNNGCTPPGLTKQRNFYDGWWTRDGGHYRDGYLVRYDGDRPLGFLPLLGGAIGIGVVFPTYYRSYDVPDYYSRYYGGGGGGDYVYRQADGVIYGLDPDTYAVRSIAGLVTGDEFAIGRRMPDGYSVYNVPYEYRGRYVDDADSWYRYNDGYVYEVDPTTQLVSAVIQLLS